MAVSRGKMLGRYLRTRCPGPRGYKCPHCGEDDTTQWRKRIERREVRREVDEEMAELSACMSAGGTMTSIYGTSDAVKPKGRKS